MHMHISVCVGCALCILPTQKACLSSAPWQINESPLLARTVVIVATSAATVSGGCPSNGGRLLMLSMMTCDFSGSGGSSLSRRIDRGDADRGDASAMAAPRRREMGDRPPWFDASTMCPEMLDCSSMSCCRDLASSARSCSVSSWFRDLEPRR